MTRTIIEAFAYALRSAEKLLLDPLRYIDGRGYHAERFWKERFQRHGGSLRGPGHEGWSEEQNAAAYAMARERLSALLDAYGIKGSACRATEIGPGTGVWTELLHQRGLVRVVAQDITDARFEDLRNRFPEYSFIKDDATERFPVEPADLILVLDVIEHVVEVERLHSLLGLAQERLVPGGLLFLSFPPPGASRRNRFYLHYWTEQEVGLPLTNCELVERISFRDGILLGFRKLEIPG